MLGNFVILAFRSREKDLNAREQILVKREDELTKSITEKAKSDQMKTQTREKVVIIFSDYVIPIYVPVC